MSQIKIYGIKACDTMKKAMTWLDENGIGYTFHDYKKLGLDESLAEQWVSELPLEELINKRGTTWRKLDEETKVSLSKETAPALICENTSMIKRPLLDTGSGKYLGFKPEIYSEIFAK